MKKALSTTLFLFILFSAFAQNRVEKPIQIQTNWSGVFLKAFGNALADPEIQSLEIENWGIPGVSIGYHLNKRFYVGYSFQPNRSLTLVEEWTFSDKEINDAMITVEHKTGTFHDLNFRYTPFKFGAYLSGNIFHTTKGDYDMEALPLENSVQFGRASNFSQVDADWNFRSFSAIGLGLGYNYVHNSGVSFDLGIGLPIPFLLTPYENINYDWAEDIWVPEDDVNFATEKLENELFFFPVRINLNVGYNFGY